MPGNMMLARRIKDAVERSIQTSKCYPATGEKTLTGASGADTQGSYTELVASTSTKVKIESVAVYALSAADRYTIQISTGAAAAESVISTFSVGGGAAASFVVPVTCPEIDSSTRIACSVACVSGGSDTCKVVLNYVEIT